MDRVACLPADDRSALFTETAASAGLIAKVAEKDFWVCWTLKRLYGIEPFPRLLFKGGTSLSKCFGLIERFSEDIDLGLEREDIGLGGDLAPSRTKGSSSQKKARKRLQEGAQEYVEGHFAPAVQDDFEGVLTEPFSLRFRADRKESIVTFEYPRALGTSAYTAQAYITSVVRLEIGARSDHHPTEEVRITPYAAERAPGWFQQSTCQVVAQSPVRTLLEKALILHTDIARNRMRPRSARHAYDLVMMHRAGTTSKVGRDLFEEVALHKLIFADDRHAGLAPEQGIRMVPEGTLRRELEQDFLGMNEMFFREPPPFVELIEGLRALESAINSLPR